jgi:hypothetical protein
MRRQYMPLRLRTKCYICMTCIAMAALCQGCLPEYYPGSWASPVIPVISQLDTQKEHSKCIGLDAGYTRRWNEEEKNYIVRAHYILAASGKHSSFNFGFSAFTGEYEVVQVTEYRGSYDYMGGGVLVGGNLHFSIKKANVGIGFHCDLGFEGGDYYSFRKEADDAGLAVNNTDNIYAVFTVQPLMLNYRISERELLSLQSNVTSSLGFTANLLYQRNRSCFWLGWTYSSYKDLDIYAYGAITLGVMFNYD